VVFTARNAKEIQMPGNSAFENETLSIMGRALALRIMAAVRVGQRDPQRLRDVALHVIEGCKITRALGTAPTG
jgi:hypothetical protein